MQAPQTDSLIGHYVGRYRVTRKLGTGQLGGVYEVVQQNIGHRAAMKVLRSELMADPKSQKYIERFIDEARAVNLINHPGVVQVFDLSETDAKSIYILMEYLDGYELSTHLRQVKEGAAPRLATTQIVAIIKQLASVLAVAHDKGILHRDIKPQNVFLIPDANHPGGFRVKLLDFGVALFLDTPERRTTAGIALGTPLYMSPEQCLGSDTLDGKADIYSLGAIVYELLTGAPPFVGDMSDVMRKHVREVPQPLTERAPGLHPELAALFTQLLAKRKEDRPTMRELETQLGVLEKREQLEVAAPPLLASGRPSAAPAAGQRPSAPFLAALLGGGLLLGAVLGGVGVSARKPAPPSVPQCPAAVCPPPPPRVSAQPSPAADTAAGQTESAGPEGKEKVVTKHAKGKHKPAG